MAAVRLWTLIATSLRAAQFVYGRGFRRLHRETFEAGEDVTTASRSSSSHVKVDVMELPLSRQQLRLPAFVTVAGIPTADLQCSGFDDLTVT